MNDGGVRREVAVGAVLVGSLSILALAILMIGSQSKMFVSKVRYTTTFKDVLGLKVGSPVYISGVQVGAVVDLELPTDPERQGIPVQIAVDEQFAPRVRKGTQASLAFLQLLSGDKLILLTPGDPSTEPLLEGAFIPPAETGSIFEAGASAAQNISDLAASVNDLMNSLQRGEGLLGKMLKDPTFGEEGLSNIRDAFGEARDLLQKINQSEGLAWTLMTDREFGRSTVESIHSSLQRFDSFLARLENNEGALGEMLRDDGAGRQTLIEMRGAVQDARGLMEQIRAGRGLVGKMLYDEEYAARVAEDLRGAVSASRSILEKIDRGDGSAGRFVNDPAVYEGVQNLVVGVNKSRTGKWFIQKSVRKGEKERAGDADGTSRQPAPPPDSPPAPRQSPAPPPDSPPAPRQSPAPAPDSPPAPRQSPAPALGADPLPPERR